MIYVYTSELFTFTFTWGQCKYLSNAFIQSHVNVLGYVSVNVYTI